MGLSSVATVWGVWVWSLSQAAGAPAAGEDETPNEDIAPPVLTGSVDVGVFAQRQSAQDVVAVSPLVSLGVRARPEVELGMRAGASTLAVDAREEGQHRVVVPSNFVFGAGWIRDHERFDHHGHLGFAFALPTAFDPDPRAGESAMYATAVRGALDPWQWAPSTMAVILPGGWSWSSGHLELGADGAVAGMFSAAGDPGDPGLAAQARATAALRWDRVRLGGALAAAYNGRDRNGPVQTSASPFAETPLCIARPRMCGVHLRAAATLNLNAPYGFADGGARVWGMVFGLRWAVRDAV